MSMAVNFDTGSKWLDNYYEAYYEVIECYYDSLDKQYGGNQYYNYDWSNYYDQNILPSAKQLAASTKGIYSSKYYNDYYEDFYKDYFSKNSWDTIWTAYGYGDCDVDKIIKRWGFSSKKDTACCSIVLTCVSETSPSITRLFLRCQALMAVLSFISKTSSIRPE